MTFACSKKKRGRERKRGDRGEGGLRRKCLHRGEDPKERAWIIGSQLPTHRTCDREPKGRTVVTPMVSIKTSE